MLITATVIAPAPMAPAVHENDRPRALHGCEWHEALNAHAMNPVLCLIHVNLAYRCQYSKAHYRRDSFLLGSQCQDSEEPSGGFGKKCCVLFLSCGYWSAPAPVVPIVDITFLCHLIAAVAKSPHRSARPAEVAFQIRLRQAEPILIGDGLNVGQCWFFHLSIPSPDVGAGR
jgi:hypothetical protein